MEKFLICDADRSLATIGGPSKIQEITGGLPPIHITRGINEVAEKLGKLFSFAEVSVKHPIFDEMITESAANLTELCKTQGITGIAIDTISHIFRQDLRILERKNKSEAMEMQDWGKLERTYNRFLENLKILPIWVIVNCHVKYDKDPNGGTFYFAPQIKGATQEFLPEYFDCVFYTKADKSGKRNYTWQTFADQSRYGKDRLGILEPIIAQDFHAVISAYRKEGIDNPKILVLGESGTGKSRALTSVQKG